MATKRWYRSKNGEFLGVCKGFADWLDFPVGIIRLIFIIVCVCTAVFPCLLVYFLLALALPVNPYEKKEERTEDENSFRSRVRNKFERRFSSDKAYSTDDYVVVDNEGDMDEEFERLKKKAHDINSRPLDKEEDWDNRFNQSN